MLRRVQINKDNAFGEGLRQLYNDAFPEREKAPYDDFIKLFDIMDMDYQAYYEGEMLVGMTIVIRMKKYNYAADFAVVEKLRGKGYGQKILSDLLERYSKENPLVMEVESPLDVNAPNLEFRKRRHTFYLRNGIKDTCKYFNFNGVEYTIMTTSKDPVSQEDIDDAFAFLKPLSEKVIKVEQ